MPVAEKEKADHDPAGKPAGQRKLTPAAERALAEAAARRKARDEASPPQEIGGRQGPDPTRYGDWEVGGRCIDF
jgi:hypothetical protein